MSMNKNWLPPTNSIDRWVAPDGMIRILVQIHPTITLMREKNHSGGLAVFVGLVYRDVVRKPLYDPGHSALFIRSYP